VSLAEGSVRFGCRCEDLVDLCCGGNEASTGSDWLCCVCSTVGVGVAGSCVWGTESVADGMVPLA
jgi:hypothetical protein